MMSVFAALRVGIILVVLMPASVRTAARNSSENETTASPLRQQYDETDPTIAATSEPEAIQTPPTYYIETIIASGFDTYGGGFLLFLSVTTNGLSIAVFLRKQMRRNVTSLFMIALAITDLLFVLIGQGARHWVRTLTGVDPPSLHTWYCKMWFLTANYTSAYSNWVLAGLTVERCIVVMAPLKAQALITRRAVKTYLAVSLLGVMVYYAHNFITIKTVTKTIADGSTVTICTVNMDNYFAVAVRPMSNYVLKVIIPSGVIIIGNILLVIKLIQARIQRREMIAGDMSDQTDHTNSVIRMSITISVAFVLLNTPLQVSYVLLVVFPAGYVVSGHQAAVERLVWAVSLFCLYANSSVNFILCLISSSTFRREMRDMARDVCCCCCCGGGDGGGGAGTNTLERKRPVSAEMTNSLSSDTQVTNTV